MADLLPAWTQSFFLDKKTGRQLGKAVERVDAEVVIARRVDLKRIERVAEATEQGMIAVAHLTAVESMLIGTVPLAEARLRAVADGGAAAIGRIVLESGR